MTIGRIKIYLFTGIAAISSTLVQAETAYVNDRIYLGVYAEPNTDGKAILTLQSGVKLEVLERMQGFARIQTSANQEGWVRDSFIAEEKPASVRIKEVEAERDKLQAALKAIPSADEVVVLKNDLTNAENQIQELKNLLNDQVSTARDVEKLAEKNAPKKPSDNFNLSNEEWSQWRERVILAAVFMLVGLLTGVMIMTQKIKKRFGGYKVW